MRSFYKIVHTSARTVWGNTEKRILEESIWMKGQGHQVIVMAPGNSPLILKAREQGLTAYEFSFRGLARINEYSKLLQILYNEQPNVINAHGRTDAGMALKAAKKSGVACRIISRHTGKRLKKTLSNKNLYKKLSHYVFTTSTDTCDHLKTLFHLSDMEIFSIPGSMVEPLALAPKEAARKDLALGLELDPSTQFLGFLRPPANPKKLKSILRAFKLGSLPKSRHLIFTDKTLEHTREMIITAGKDLDISGQIHFHPPKPGRNWDVYRGIDACILMPGPHALEGVPLEMIKAMYASCPIIGPGTPGIKDLLIHEKTGLCFDPDAPHTLSKMIQKTLDQEAAALERTYAARNMVKKHYTMDAMGRDIIRIYRLHQVKMDRQFHPIPLI
ncbi:MAG: glycosyltransferase family 4 protein [Desulfobacter sp.]|nr:glycosyltransferase family 4 protein [Desulfobacter sp.]WDP85528.1 MAG: glycosyltransferase family 4 protein [Desulfobacter sp.]